MGQFAWRKREALLGAAKVHRISEGVALAKQAVAAGAKPVVLADHSDRSGSATWFLQEIVRQDLGNTLIATLADAKATAALKARGAKPGDPFDMAVGGLVDESAGEPVRVQGTVLNAVDGYGQHWVTVGFGRGNVLVLSGFLVQVMEPEPLRALELEIERFDVFAIKSRALPPRFRRFRFRQDHPAGRTGPALPRHREARRAAVHERRHPQVLSLRQSDVPLIPSPALRESESDPPRPGPGEGILQRFGLADAMRVMATIASSGAL
jgi:hypothetical protein